MENKKGAGKNGIGKKNGDDDPIYSKQTKGAEDYDSAAYTIAINDMLRLHVAAVTDVGIKRKKEALEELKRKRPETSSLSPEERDALTQANEDNFALRDDGLLNGLLVLADGMGGHQAGEVASELACNTFIENISSVLESSSGNAAPHFPSLLVNAQNAIFHYAQQNSEAEGLGCALVAAQFQANATLVYANVGDTRLYVWDPAKPEGTTPGCQLEQLTADDSHVWWNRGFSSAEVWEEYQKGNPEPKEKARLHPRKNLLAKAIGFEDMQFETTLQQQRPVKPGEVYLLCSDGLWDELSDKQINDILLWAYQQYPKNDFEAANALVNAAKAVGGNDNITVILARVAPTEKALYQDGFHAWKRKDKNALADIVEQNPEIFLQPQTGEAHLLSGIYAEHILKNNDEAYAGYQAAWKYLWKTTSFFGVVRELMHDSPLRQAVSGYLRLGWQQRKKKKVKHYEAPQLEAVLADAKTEELPYDSIEQLEDARVLPAPLAYEKVEVIVEEVPDAPVIPLPAALEMPQSLEDHLNSQEDNQKTIIEMQQLVATVQQQCAAMVTAANTAGLELFKGYEETILESSAYKAFLAFETVMNIVPGLEEALIVQWDHLIKKADESGHREVSKALVDHLYDGTYDKEKIAKEVFLGYYEDAEAEFHASGDSISALKKLNLDELDDGAKSYKGGEGAVRLLTAEILFVQGDRKEAEAELRRALESADFSDSRYGRTREYAEDVWRQYFPTVPIPQQVADGNGKKKNGKGHLSSIAEEVERLYAAVTERYESWNYEQAIKMLRAIIVLDPTHQKAQSDLEGIALQTQYAHLLSAQLPAPATGDHEKTVAERYQVIYVALEEARAAAERNADEAHARIRGLERTIAVFERQDAERKYTEQDVEERCTNARADALDEAQREYEPQIETLKATTSELLEQIANAKEVTPQELERIVEERLRRKLGEETYTQQQVDETATAVRAAALAEAEQKYASQIAAEKERYKALDRSSSAPNTIFSRGYSRVINSLASIFRKDGIQTAQATTQTTSSETVVSSVVAGYRKIHEESKKRMKI